MNLGPSSFSIAVRRDPIDESLLELQRFDNREDTADRVMSRSTASERDKLTAPRQLRPSKLSDIGGPITSGKRSGDTHEKDVDQLMCFAAFHSRIVDVGEMGRKVEC
jgi:hypothetical protein